MTIKPQPSPKTRQATLFHVALACAAIVTPASALAPSRLRPRKARRRHLLPVSRARPGQPIQGKSAGPRQPRKNQTAPRLTTISAWRTCTRTWPRTTAGPSTPRARSRNTSWRSTPTPASKYLNSGLAELYLRTGRVRDAVLAAQDILKTEPEQPRSPQAAGPRLPAVPGQCAEWRTFGEGAAAGHCRIHQDRATAEPTTSRAVCFWGSFTLWPTTRRMRKSSLRRRSTSIPIQKM